MNREPQFEDIDMYVSSKIKPNWLRAYENGNFGDDFPPDLQASQTTDSSKEFMANIFNRIGNKQNYQKPVVSTDGVMPATQFMMMPPQNIPINNIPCQLQPMVSIQQGIFARNMNRFPSFINIDPRVQIPSGFCQFAPRFVPHTVLPPILPHQNVHYQNVPPTINTQRPTDPRLRREWQPVSTHSVPHMSDFQPVSATPTTAVSTAAAAATTTNDSNHKRVISVADYKRCTSDLSEREKDREISTNQECSVSTSLVQTIANDEQTPVVANNMQIDSTNEHDQVASHNDIDQTLVADALSFESAVSSPLVTLSPIESPIPSPNYYEEMENVAEEEITIKEETVNDTTQNVEDDYDSDDSNETQIFDFYALNEERKTDLLKEPVIIDIGEVNMSPQFDMEQEFQPELKEETSTESEEVEDSDSQKETDDLLVPFDHSRTVRIVLEDISLMDSSDFLIKKKRMPAKPLPKTPSESESESELDRVEPVNASMVQNSALDELPAIEITSSDDDFVYEISSDDSDTEVIRV